jgi:hypothetical protein
MYVVRQLIPPSLSPVPCPSRLVPFPLRCRWLSQPSLLFPEPDPDSESRSPSPYGECDTCKPHFILYSGNRDSKQAGPSTKTVECFLCKQKGHYSNECLKKASGKRSANAEKAGEEKAKEALVNTVDEDQPESGDEQFFSKGEDEESQHEQEEQHESSSNEDGLSLEDWTCAARGIARSDEDNGASEVEDDHIVYRGEPRSCNKAGLLDWSEMEGTPYLPEGTGSKEETSSVDELEQYCLATYLAEDETMARTSKINEQPGEQVTYRQQATKELGPFKISDGPK